MKKLAVSVLAVLALSSSAAFANPPSADNPAGREILGVAPAHGLAGVKRVSGSNLSYHGGPVLHGEKTYAIYWVPPGYTVSSTYQSLIDGFFGNVATANSGGYTGDTYFSDTQYTDGG